MQGILARDARLAFPASLARSLDNASLCLVLPQLAHLDMSFEKPLREHVFFLFQIALPALVVLIMSKMRLCVQKVKVAPNLRRGKYRSLRRVR